METTTPKENLTINIILLIITSRGISPHPKLPHPHLFLSHAIITTTLKVFKCGWIFLHKRISVIYIYEFTSLFFYFSNLFHQGKPLGSPKYYGFVVIERRGIYIYFLYCDHFSYFCINLNRQYIGRTSSHTSLVLKDNKGWRIYGFFRYAFLSLFFSFYNLFIQGKPLSYPKYCGFVVIGRRGICIVFLHCDHFS